MASDQEPLRIGRQPPFSVPAERRDPARRLRGRLVAPVRRDPPPIRGPFERLEVAESPWGPVLGGRRPRAACRLAESTPAGHGELVQGVIEQLELADLEDPLAYLHGRHRPVGDLPDHG